MEQDVQATYLEAAVQTATPQKLRLMLIDGAIRFATRAKQQWCRPISYEVLEDLRRCQQIVAELYSSVRRDENDVAQKTADLYLFLYREVLAAPADTDTTRLDGVLRVLEIERETWRQVCEQLPDAPVREHDHGPREITADGQQVEQPTYGIPGSPVTTSDGPLTSSNGDGLSLEA